MATPKDHSTLAFLLRREEASLLAGTVEIYVPTKEERQ
jgi:hypothetical protein